MPRHPLWSPAVGHAASLSSGVQASTIWAGSSHLVSLQSETILQQGVADRWTKTCRISSSVLLGRENVHTAKKPERGWVSPRGCRDVMRLEARSGNKITCCLRSNCLTAQVNICNQDRIDAGCARAAGVSNSRMWRPPVGACRTSGGKSPVVVTKSQNNSNVVVPSAGVQSAVVHSNDCAHVQTAHANLTPHVLALKTRNGGRGSESAAPERSFRESQCCTAGP